MNLPVYKFFDKFVNVEFEEYMSVKAAEDIYKREEEKERLKRRNPGAELIRQAPTDAEWSAFLDSATGKFRIETPRSGVKPHISVSAKFLPGLRVSEVTVSIKNLEIDVNINLFTFMRVRMGYFDGPSVMFRGAIMNSYVENPNPNGNTVFQMLASGILEDMLGFSDITLEAFGPTYWISGLEKICAALNIPLDRSEFNTIYDKIPLMNAPKKKLHFKTGLDVVNYFKSAAEVIFPQYGFNAPDVKFDKEAIIVTSNDDALQVPDIKETAQKLDMIKTASFTGGGVMIKALYNPFITPMSYFYIDPIYFRGRLNSQNMRTNQNIIMGAQAEGLASASVDVKNGVATAKQDRGVGVAEDGFYRVLNMSVQFDTYNTNETQILGVMANATVDNSETFARAITEYQEDTADDFSLRRPPYTYPPFFKVEKQETSEEPKESESGGKRPPSLTVVISENSKESTAKSQRITLSTILNKYINEPFAKYKYDIEFAVGDKSKMYKGNNLNRPDRETSNGLFVHSPYNWFNIHTLLISGDKESVSLIDATDETRQKNFSANVFGQGAQTCLQGLADRIKALNRKYNIPNGALFGSVYSIFFMLCQRKRFNGDKDKIAPEIAPYVSGYIIPGEELLDGLVIDKNNEYCDNDFIYKRKFEYLTKEYTLRIAGPDWEKCLKKDNKTAALFRDLEMWAEGKRAYSTYPWTDFARAASWFRP
jgi:hypothetical protein